MDYLTWILPTAFLAAMAWIAVRRGYQMRGLVAHGKPISGKVLQQTSFAGTKGVRSRFLHYEFTLNGRRYCHKIAVTADENDLYQEGDVIELVYLPSNPKISARVEMVEQCRQALSKQKI